MCIKCANDLIEIAAKEVGIHEDGGNNCGKRVEEYLASVGLTRGNPWCAALVSWVFQQAGIEGWPSSGDTWAFRSWAQREKCYSKVPSHGDVFLLLDSQGDPMHTGFVTDITGDMVHTIEGNTGGGSTADGDGVYVRARPVRDCMYVHWQDKLHRSAEGKSIKAFWHDSHGQVILEGRNYPVKGVKINGVPWAGGDILITYQG